MPNDRFCASELGHDPHEWSAPEGFDVLGVRVIEGRTYQCTGYPIPGGPGWRSLTDKQKRSAAATYVEIVATRKLTRRVES